MKTIILYATKYGASREIARQIADKLPDASLCDLKRENVPSLSQYDCVVIGGSLYAGMLRKEAKRFAEENAAALSEKKLGLFLSGMGSPEKAAPGFGSNFPEVLLKKATAKAFLGGIFDPSKASALDKLIFKAAAKQSVYSNQILDDKITEFTDALKG